MNYGVDDEAHHQKLDEDESGIGVHMVVELEELAEKESVHFL